MVKKSMRFEAQIGGSNQFKAQQLGPESEKRLKTPVWSVISSLKTRSTDRWQKEEKSCLTTSEFSDTISLVLSA